MTVADRLAVVRRRLDAAAHAAGRAPESVRLVAVSKTRPPEAIREAMESGQTLFGENYAQELRDKFDVLASEAPAPTWHFIGHLQRNKVRNVVGRAELIHAVDSLRLGEAIGQRAARSGASQRVLVAVNVTGEASKNGVSRQDALSLCQALNAVPGLELAGLMTMPPWTSDPEASAPVFEALAELADTGRRAGLPLHELSMGMSQDFEVAVRYGATLVRVGTAIFGPRG